MRLRDLNLIVAAYEDKVSVDLKYSLMNGANKTTENNVSKEEIDSIKLIKKEDGSWVISYCVDNKEISAFDALNVIY